MDSRPPARLRIGLYSPFFGSTYGGGEKYLGAAAEALRDGFPDALVEIISPVPVDVARYESMLGLNLDGVTLRCSNARPGGFKRYVARVPSLRRVRDLALSVQVARISAEYDLLLSMVYVLPAFTRARRSVILCQFPYDPRRIRLPQRVVRRLLLGREVDDFQLVVCQSEYVRGWVRALWGRDSLIVNPPIDVPALEPDWGGKERLVLGAGRFFASGHSKRHDLMVETFRRMCDEGLTGWELHLAGSLHRSYAADVEYFDRVRQLATGYPIHIHVDCPRHLLLRLYSQASIYWHAAGYGVDANTRPEAVEHFGMTTAEAMAHGAVPVAFARGGQLEVVETGISGFLWEDPGQLSSITRQLIEDSATRCELGKAAWRRSRRFSRAEFDRRIVSAVEPLIMDLERGARNPLVDGSPGSIRESSRPHG